MSDQVPVLADTLRVVMASQGIKLTQLSQLTDIPYRSLQNYFSRRTEMPATVYLKICAALDLDPYYHQRERFSLDSEALRDALIKRLGNLLPTVYFTDDDTMGLRIYSGPDRSADQLRRDASTVAHSVADAYDQFREVRMRKPRETDD